MPWLEIAAALLGVVNVVLVVRRSIWNYPFGIAMVALYFFVFWTARLYSDALLQVFFLVIQIYGWRVWLGAKGDGDDVPVAWLDRPARKYWALGTGTAVLLWGAGMARWTDAAAPFVDAMVAALSISAQLLQSRRRVDSWVLWIAVDVIAVGLYAWRGLGVSAALYGLFLVLAVLGLREWKGKART